MLSIYYLKSSLSTLNVFRHCIRRFSDSLTKGIEYHGFTYYPRHKNFKDPPYTPSKLFLVKRIKSMSGTNPNERDALMRLNIDGHRKHKGHISVVKNIPQINALLWKVKHLVEIKPITYSGEIPEDFCGTFLRETGELVISPKLKVSDEVLQKSYEKSPRFKKHYLKELLRKAWNNGQYNI